MAKNCKLQPIAPIREALLKGRLSTVDLLVLTSLDQLLFTLKILFTLFTKHVILLKGKAHYS
jgi:hypothetical protein